MLRFRDLLNFPPFYSKRNKSIKTVAMRITDVQKEEGQEGETPSFIEIKGSSNKYNQLIRINDLRVNMNSYVQVFCDCPSFKFDFAHANFKGNSLLFPEKFGKDIIRRPSERNRHIIESGCKHVIALTRLFNSQKNRYI